MWRRQRSTEAQGLRAHTLLTVHKHARRHANNCEGIHPSYAVALEQLGSYVQVRRMSRQAGSQLACTQQHC